MTQKEYGGYIEFEYFHGQEFHEDAVRLNSGRHGLEYLIRAKHIKHISLPYFLCDTVKMICDKFQVKVNYYHVNLQFEPICDRTFVGDEWLYIVNYYGQISNEQIAYYKKKYGNIIIDNVQAFFQRPVDGIDTIYTCRKFFGVSDGGYLYTDTKLDVLEKDYSYDRMQFLFGRLEKSANEFYSDYVENNKMFRIQDVKEMSAVTRNIMRGLDYEYIINRRTENFKILDVEFGKINKIKLHVVEGAFMYPLYIEYGEEIRKCLQKEKIYIPTLWPDVFDICTPDDLEYDMARNILPIPVDQRYNEEDMNYLIREVKACID